MAEPFIPPTAAKTPAAGNTAAPPAIDADKLAGKTSIDAQMSFEVELLVHVSLSNVLKAVAHRVKEHLSDGTRLIFLDTRVAAALESAELFEAQCSVLENSFKQAKSIAVKALATAGVEGLGAESFTAAAAAAAVNLLGILKEDVVYSGRTVKVDESTIAAELGRHFENGIQYLWPSLFISDLCATKSGEQEPQQSLNTVMKARQEAADAISMLLAVIRSIKDDEQKLSIARSSMDQARAQFDSADVILRQFSLGSIQTNEKTGLTPLGAVQLGIKVRTLLTEGAHLIWVRVAAAGGSYRIRNGLIPSLIGRALSYSGGVVLAYALLDQCGKIVISGQAYHCEPYTRFASLRGWWDNLWEFPFHEGGIDAAKKKIKPPRQD